MDADITFVSDAIVWGIFPHTHVRGKSWEYTLELPDGTTKAILSVPRYDFNWQTYYMFKDPLEIPKGSRPGVERLVRQFGGEQVEPGPENRRQVGRSDVGGDAVHRDFSSARHCR